MLRVQVRGKRRDIGLGGVVVSPLGRASNVGTDVPLESKTHLSLAEVRELSIRLRNAAKAGKDPAAELKRDRKLAPTFKDAVETAHKALSDSWSDREAKAFLSSLKNHAFASLGNKRVDAVSADDVASTLTPIWKSKPSIAKKVSRRINVVLDFASAKGWRTTAAPREQVRVLTGKGKKGGNFPSMPYDDAPTYWKHLASQRQTVGRLALMFLIATGARSIEVREARWCHIDLERAEWSRPMELMRKSEQAHVVTLNEAAIGILQKIRALLPPAGPDAFIFANRKGGMISDMTISKVMRDDDQPFVPHGFRASLRTWAAEKQPLIPEPVAEAALSHVIPDAVIKAYNRAAFLDMRRKLLDQWGAFIMEGKWSVLLPGDLVVTDTD